jgi:hypothetical protein
VENFTILYLRGSELEKAEQVRVADVLAAIRAAAGQPGDLTVEIWQGERRVALIGSVVGS